MPTYRDIEGFPGYLVGDDGSILTAWSRNAGAKHITDTWSTRKSYPDKDGYPCIKLSQKGKKITHKVHHLVLKSFVGPHPDGMECCHENGIRSDCRLSNLRWDTRESNRADNLRHGTSTRGERNPRARLTESDVLAIRKEIESGKTQAEIANVRGIPTPTVNNIKSGRAWAWLVAV